MDFVSDGLANGRRVRCLTIIDDCTRECVAIEVDTSITGARVKCRTRALCRPILLWWWPWRRFGRRAKEEPRLLSSILLRTDEDGLRRTATRACQAEQLVVPLAIVKCKVN